ncbi:N-acetyl-D-Glu racemase DgcA [Niveispirillum sp.]|uniref:N-acetyl-D-Glu racemase DgcA n=1 Tax=Niveispirillum sp. TaxID=1917217 RepID=UPI001B42AF4F|nr:N-acetyl-D-Glu racemase DgcA [Niveispirillum sp.]MBP7336756.1 dipeptide epimerase [Niveispirillum sp.]
MPFAPAPAASLSVRLERFPIRGTFRISRGAKTEAAVLVAELRDADGRVGRGECVPYARYGESVEGVMAAMEAMADAFARGLSRRALAHALPAGAARNALDCALWDLEVRRSGRPAWELAGLAPLEPVVTAFTLSIDTAESMADAACAVARPLLKLKLAGDGGDLERVAAVRNAAPDSRLIVDANEGWKPDDLATLPDAFARLGVEMIEQPLPAGADDALIGFNSPVRLGADESTHGLDGLEELARRYQVVNVKLDKTGGLTEALAVKARAQSLGLDVMVGCMVATSLSMAPALLLAQGADYVDLDGPLLLARDREPGLVYDGARLLPTPGVWG